MTNVDDAMNRSTDEQRYETRREEDEFRKIRGEKSFCFISNLERLEKTVA